MDGKKLSRLLDKKEALEQEEETLTFNLNGVREELVQVRIDIQNHRNN